MPIRKGVYLTIWDISDLGTLSSKVNSKTLSRLLFLFGASFAVFKGGGGGGWLRFRSRGLCTIGGSSLAEVLYGTYD